jgi:sterol desaturase/sphingolipid hydroxylase (fatty acid hydroxylase superfamily)
MKLTHKLLHGELPTPSEKWRFWVALLVAFFSVNFAIGVVIDALFNHTIMLGPGLVDTGISTFETALQTLNPLLDDKHYLFIALYLPALLCCLVINALVTYRGFTHYEKHRGEPYSLQLFFTLFLLNAVNVGFWLLMLVMFGGLSWLLWSDFSLGGNLVHTMTVFSQSIIDKVPTLVELPYPLPLIVTILLLDLFFYWLHRIGHNQRLSWLVWHRPHHMSPALLHPTTQPVFVAAPLFIFFAIPFQILIGVLAKLFGPEAMIMEALWFRLLIQFFAPWSHNSAFYEWFGKGRIRMFFAHMTGTANYHYMHHSALPGHEAINLAGTMFLFWDKVFGTFVAPHKEKPPVGLTGSPKLHSNPFRLAIAGMWQLAYELKHNKGFGVKMKILFGSTSWNPPVTRDFAICDSAAENTTPQKQYKGINTLQPSS